ADVVVHRADVADAHAAAVDEDVDAAGRAVVAGAGAAEGQRVGGLQLLRQPAELQPQLRGVPDGDVLAAGLLRQPLERGLVDAVVVDVDGQLLEQVDQLLPVAGVVVLAAGLLGHAAHDGLVDLLGPAEAEHVQRDAGLTGAVDHGLVGVPAAGGALVPAV